MSDNLLVNGCVYNARHCGGWDVSRSWLLYVCITRSRGGGRGVCTSSQVGARQFGGGVINL